MFPKRVIGEAFCSGAVLASSAGQTKTLHFWSLTISFSFLSSLIASDIYSDTKVLDLPNN